MTVDNRAATSELDPMVAGVMAQADELHELLRSTRKLVAAIARLGTLYLCIANAQHTMHSGDILVGSYRLSFRPLLDGTTYSTAENKKIRLFRMELSRPVEKKFLLFFKTRRYKTLVKDYVYRNDDSWEVFRHESMPGLFCLEDMIYISDFFKQLSVTVDAVKSLAVL